MEARMANFRLAKTKSVGSELSPEFIGIRLSTEDAAEVASHLGKNCPFIIISHSELRRRQCPNPIRAKIDVSYQLCEELGRGQFSITYLRQTSMEVKVKAVRPLYAGMYRKKGINPRSQTSSHLRGPLRPQAPRCQARPQRGHVEQPQIWQPREVPPPPWNSAATCSAILPSEFRTEPTRLSTRIFLTTSVCPFATARGSGVQPREPNSAAMICHSSAQLPPRRRGPPRAKPPPRRRGSTSATS